MSETEPIPPTSSVTALRIPIIKKDADLYGKPIKARFGGNEASPPKKMQKEFYANLKFLRSLPSVWHVVATMIRGQPGLDELDFDDLYNNLKLSYAMMHWTGVEQDDWCIEFDAEDMHSFGESSTKFHDYASLTVDALDSMTGDRTCCLILKEFKGGYVALDMTSKVFKNQLMNRVCAKKGIKSDIAHCQDSHRQMVLQKERTVYIEEVVRCRDSLLPIQFWAEAVNTACYVLNRVLGRQLCLIQRTRNVCDDVEDLDDHIFIVQYSFAYASGGTLCAKEVSLSSEEQSLHEEDCIRVMTSRSLAKLIMMIKRIAFERIRGDISCKGKEQILMMIIQKLVFSLQTLLMLGRRVADYNKMDPTIDVPSDSPAL
ncbi:hypothetical protein Tco_0424851 [Tanacetum coccineum]